MNKIIDKKELWEIVLSDLELNLSKANFKTWFSNTRILKVKDKNQTVVVGVPTNFSKDWLEKKYHRSILDALQDAMDSKVRKVIYKVAPLKKEKRKKSEPVKSEPKKDCFKNNSKAKNSYGLNPIYTFKNFVVGKGSELAYAACKSVADEVGTRYNPLFIYGDVGLGKTHLLQAVGHEVLKSKKDIKILYTNAEKFTNEFIRAISNNQMNKFKQKYRGLDVLLIDDVQFMAGKERTQEEFFHTFNSLYQEDRQIIITSDRTPKAIPALEDRLISRLEWGLIADISSPDLETRIAILKTKANKKGFKLSDNIIQYLASHIQSNVRELEGALNKLIAYCDFHKTEMSLDVAKNILSGLKTNKNKSLIRPKLLIKTVANFYGIPLEKMLGSSRKREVVVPRQVAMYLMREEIDSSFPAIGERIGERDHTTAMHAHKKITKEIKKEGRIKQEVDLIKQRLYNQ
ncbi:MAG TPA: chromosomal replication initiator protein DnaA [Patescibacteria group bacterium]|nr:chromosomal replication initiator protein DnaA [Patescibacteria group bacterium]